MNNLENFKSIINSEFLSHAFLFFGQDKEFILKNVKVFCKFLNCENIEYKNKIFKDDEKYNCDCKQCLMIDKLEHPDLYFLKREDGKKEIVNSQIYSEKSNEDDLISKLSTGSVYSKYKIAIIYDADFLNKSSSNALLKSLEEPKVNVIFILISTNKDNILKTILSRCSIINLNSSINFDFENKIEEIKKFISVIKADDYQKILYIREILKEKQDLNYYLDIFYFVLEQVSISKYKKSPISDLIADLEVNKDINKSLKKLYNIKEALKNNYIIKTILIDFMLELK